ncbi:MAG: SusD/RagB family nutrient-binding outer membrane lipoprotein [Bacteroidales bacterium]|nr:SusD/RagB family nutrient-binding outer membrane lipoprotein [Bacteroidales bacterium]
MKTINKILLCGLAVMGVTLSSCSNWLDVNVDPENPTAETSTYDGLLGNVEFYTNSAHQFADWRTGQTTGDWTGCSGRGNYANSSFWLPANAWVTTSYQWWFVGAYVNIPQLIEKAEAAEAWHYAAVARVIKAYGFMLMTDLYGEMPYEEAAGTDPSITAPKYATGKTIFLGCLNDIDDALKLFDKEQSTAAASLAVGDWWMNGDVGMWKKFANFLKARWILKLSKKQAGSYLDGKYDEDAILAALNASFGEGENSVIHHLDGNSTTHDHLGWDEPVDYSPLYSVCGMNWGYLATKMLYDNLTNFDGLGVEDPRADHMLPWREATSPRTDGITLDPVTGTKWTENGVWYRGLGVDLSQPIFSQNGPLRSYKDNDGAWYIDTQTEARKGDTLYVEMTSSSKGYDGNKDLLFRRGGKAISGSFYTRVSSPTYLGTYAEACFIKAEVLFKKHDQTGAFNAYKEGVKASIALMNEQLKLWVAEDITLNDCPSFKPMDQADIDNYINNGIGTAADLTLARILTQKRLHLMHSIEVWNDMRRYDFSEDMFLNWHIAADYYVNTSALKAIPEGKHLRRWRQCSHELNYNSENLKAIGLEVPGADTTLDQWNNADDVWTIPVWWDSDQG